jgi:hypothetical protein
LQNPANSGKIPTMQQSCMTPDPLSFIKESYQYCANVPFWGKALSVWADTGSLFAGSGIFLLQGCK